MALIILGASFAHLKIPRPILRLPFAAMILVTLLKMVLMPVIGILIVQAMVRSGFIPKYVFQKKVMFLIYSDHTEKTKRNNLSPCSSVALPLL